MERRPLGNTSLLVSRLSLGCVTFGREIDEAAAYGVLDAAVESGVNLVDTAASYGGGRSEEIVGRWIRDRRCRDRLLVQTKVLPPLDRGSVLAAVNASLRRLGTDYLDVALFHAPDPGTGIVESVEALDRAVRAGKVRFGGCSNFSAAQLGEFLDAAGPEGRSRFCVTQFNYNFAVRHAEDELLPKCARLGVGVETYSPLGAGFLTGKYGRDGGGVPLGSRFDVVPGHREIYFREECFRAAARLQELSARAGVPVAQLAVAWVLKNDAVTTVAFGARNPGQVASAVSALSVEFDRLAGLV